MRSTDIKYASADYCRLAVYLFIGIAATYGYASESPMNVLFITIDDLRPELASYKTDGILTPHIDRLADKGLQFNAAYCQYPVCNASRCSFLTGLRPDKHGIFSNKVALRSKWPDLVTLPQLFRSNGYFNHANDPKDAAVLDRLYGVLKKGFPHINRVAQFHPPAQPESRTR